MRSSLKKSLYLGLAALSFASVAGVAVNNVNADAKKATKTKKAHKKAKKSTKKAKKAAEVKVSSLVNLANQDSSTTAYTLKSGSLLNRPAGVKGSHTTVSGISSNEVFMTYQQATLSNGQKYYKVVSFTNKAHRGFVAADDVNSVSTYTPQANNNNTNSVFLKYPGSQNLYTNPKGSTYKSTINIKAADTGAYAKDAFGITQTATVAATGATAYHIVDLNNANVQGWVDSSLVTNTANRYFDAKRDIKLNFVNGGNTVGSQIVNVNDINNSTLKNEMFQNPTSNDRLLTKNFVKDLFTGNSTNASKVGDDVSQFINGGLSVYDGDSGNSNQLTDLTGDNTGLAKLGYTVTASDFYSSLSNFNNVHVGDTVNINVTSTKNSDLATSKVTFKAIEPNARGQWNPADAKDITASDVSFPALSDSQKSAYSAIFTGNKNSFVDLNAILSGNSSLFDATNNYSNGQSNNLGLFDGKTSTSVTSDSQYTNGNNGVLVFNSLNDVKNALKGTTLEQGTVTGNSDNRQGGATGAWDTLSNALFNNKNSSDLTLVQLGRQYHYVYVFDKTATSKYNAWATLHGQNVTLVYDKVPVATNVDTSTSTSGWTGYQG